MSFYSKLLSFAILLLLSLVGFATPSTKAQSTSYVCSANYFASYSSTVFASYTNTINYSEVYSGATTDGQANMYVWSYNYIGKEGRVSRINSAGVETKIILNPNYVIGNMVANNSGDAFGLIVDAGGFFKIMKIAAGQNTTSIIYTFSTDKKMNGYSLRIDTAGNLYIAYKLNTSTITRIDKISSSGILLNTFTLPAISLYGNTHSYNIDQYQVSSGGLIYFPIVKTSSALSGNYYIVILNPDGTKKIDFMYSSAGVLSNFAALTVVPNGVAGGGVYLSYVNSPNSNTTLGNLNIKRIQDTDSVISSTPTFTLAGNYSGFFLKSLVTNDNSYYYFYEFSNRILYRINTSSGSLEAATPFVTNPNVNQSGINIVQNSLGEIIVNPSYTTDSFKLNCSIPYSPTVITANNLNTNPYNCYQNISSTSELNTFNCSFGLIKGLTYVDPTSVKLQMLGSGLPPVDCGVSVSVTNNIMCPNFTSGSYNTSENRQIQVNINNTGFTTIANLTTWQPFGSWSPNSITLAGPTNEILYNNKMYQVAFGTDSGLYLRSMDTSNVFGNWQRLSSITAKGTPSLSVDPNGDLYVFAHGTDNGLYYWKVGEAGGERWRRVGAITIKDAVTVHNFNGKYWLYATGTDNGLYVSKYTSFSASSYANPNWTKAGDITVNQTVQGGVIDSKLYQIAVGTDSGLYFRSAGIDEVWGSWTRYGYNTQVKAVSKPLIYNNKLAINATFFGTGSSNNSYLNSDFTSINSSFNISLNSYSTTTLGLFNNLLTEAGIGIDGRLYHKNANQENSLYLSTWIQGNNITIKNSPTQFTFNNKQYQFVRGSDNKLWMRSRN
jgi:hypothetical protein